MTLLMVSAALVAFTPLLVEPFTAFMVATIATLLHYGGSVPASLHLHPAWIDIDVLSYGCHWCKRKHRG